MNDMDRTMAPEEYSEIKKKERAEIFDLLSDATQKLLSGSRLKEYADKQAELFSHSVSNVLLIMEQYPDATWVRSFEDWKKDGVNVLRGEKGILTLGSYRYRRADGTLGTDSRVSRMFDVKQTAIKDFDVAGPGYKKVPDAIMGIYPAAVEVQDLPGGETALYDPDDRLIRVKEGLDPSTKVFAVAREQAVYHLSDNHQSGRAEVLSDAELAAYILTKHYGYDAPGVDFDGMSAAYPGKEEKDVRAQLGGIRFITEQIDRKILEALELIRSDRDDRESR